MTSWSLMASIYQAVIIAWNKQTGYSISEPLTGAVISFNSSCFPLSLLSPDFSSRHEKDISFLLEAFKHSLKLYDVSALTLLCSPINEVLPFGTPVSLASEIRR